MRVTRTDRAPFRSGRGTRRPHSWKATHRRASAGDRRRAGASPPEVFPSLLARQRLQHVEPRGPARGELRREQPGVRMLAETGCEQASVSRLRSAETVHAPSGDRSKIGRHMCDSR